MDRRHMARQLIKSSTSDNPVDILLLRSNVTPEDLTDPGDDRFKSPLLRVTLGTGGGVVHSELKERLYGSAPPSPERGGETMADPTEKGKRLPGVYKHLVPKIREMFEAGEESPRVIAKALGMPEGAVGYHISRLKTERAREQKEAESTPAQIEALHGLVDLKGKVTPLEGPNRSALPTIDDLVKDWEDVHRHDQERAAMAARVLRFLDGLKEEFKDEPELGDKVAREGVNALVDAYERLKVRQSLEVAS